MGLVVESSRLLYTVTNHLLLSVAVVLCIGVGLLIAGNVLQQLLIRDSSKPPLVFHSVPFIGSTVQYGQDPYKFFAECKRKYGDVFTFVLLGKKWTVLLGPAGNDFVFNAKHKDANAEEAYTHLTTPVFGKGVVYDVPNSVLMEQKRFVKFGLTTETFREYVPLIVAEVTEYIKLHMNGTNGISSVMKIMPEITIFTASRTLQGDEVRSQFDSSFAELYKDLDKAFTPINFLFPWLPLPRNRKRDLAQRKMTQLFMNIIEKRRKTPEVNKAKSDMIWSLMNQEYKDGRPLSDIEIAHIMIALLMAGQHTSSSTSSYALLRLGQNPHLIEALLEEQRQVLGANLPPLTYEGLGKLKLLNNVIKETLRLHHPIHSIFRKVKTPMRVIGTESKGTDDLVIPEGHYIAAVPGVSAMDEQYFPDPYKFDPYRWEKSSLQQIETSETEDYGYGQVAKGGRSPYLPFGAGRHRCIGESFAHTQLGAILATLVRNLKWTLKPGSNFPEPDYTVIHHHFRKLFLANKFSAWLCYRRSRVILHGKNEMDEA